MVSTKPVIQNLIAGSTQKPHDTRRRVAAFLHGGDDEVGAADAVAAGEDLLIRGLVLKNGVRLIFR